MLNKYIIKTALDNHPVNHDLLKEKDIDRHDLMDSINNVLEEFSIGFRLVDMETLTFREYLELAGETAENNILTFRLTFRAITGDQTFTRLVDIPLPDSDLLSLSGSKNRIVNVVSDTVMSVELDGTILVQLVKRLFTIKTLNDVCLVDGELSIITLPLSEDLHKPSSTGKMRPPLILYPLIENGISETIHPSCRIMDKTEDHGKDKVVVTSPLEDVDVKLIIDKSVAKEEPSLVDMMTHIMYMCQKIPVETSTVPDDISIDEREMWMGIFSVLSSNGKPVGFNRTDIGIHMKILETYNESKTFELLKISDIHVKRFSELLRYTCYNIKGIITDKKAVRTRSLSYSDYIYAPIINNIVSACSIMKDQGLAGQISTFIGKTNRLAITTLRAGNPALLPYQQVNAFSKFQSLRQNVRNSTKLESKIPDGFDMSLFNLIIVPTTNPTPSTINPYVKVKNNFVEVDPDGEKINRRLRNKIHQKG